MFSRSPFVVSMFAFARTIIRPRPVLYRFLDSLISVDDTARRKIRCFDIFQEVLIREIGIVDECNETVNNLVEIVGWDVRCHPDGDSCCSIDKEIGDQGWKDSRFFQ